MVLKQVFKVAVASSVISAIGFAASTGSLGLLLESRANAQAYVNNSICADGVNGTLNVPKTMVAGKSYNVGVRMFNAGNTTWIPHQGSETINRYFLGAQEPRNNILWGTTFVPLSTVVPPGHVSDFYFKVTAPSSPGVYPFSWQMLQHGVQWFGATCRVSVKVTAPLGTPKPSLTYPQDWQVIQRDTTNRAAVWIAGVVSDGVDCVEARAWPAPGKRGTPIDWKSVQCGSPGSLTRFRAPVTLDAGGWYTVEVRALKDGIPGPAAVIGHVGVGDVFITAGQSNAANFAQVRQVASTGLVTALNGNTGQWKTANDPQPPGCADPTDLSYRGTTGSPWPILGDAIARRTGLPVGMLSVAWGGSSVSQWMPRSPNSPVLPGYLHYCLTDALNKAGPNGVRAVLWHQGESDAIGTTTADYEQRLTSVIQESRKVFGFPIPWIVAKVTAPTSYIISSCRGDIACFTEVRKKMQRVLDGQQAVVNHVNDVFLGPATDSLDGPLRWEGIHMSQSGLAAEAGLWIDSIIASVGLPQ